MTQGEELLILWAATYEWCVRLVALRRHVAEHGSFNAEERMYDLQMACAQRAALYRHFGVPLP